MAGEDPGDLRAALASARGASDAEVLVAGDFADGRLADALGPEREGLCLVPTAGGPAAARNEACARARGEFHLVVDGGERLAPGAVEAHLEALGGDESLVASYGRTAVRRGGRIRLLPEEGKHGSVARRLLGEKHLVASSACLAWRAAACDGPPFSGEYASGRALRLDLALRLAAGGRPFAFLPCTVAEREPERLDRDAHEEMVKVFLGVLYGPESLDEKSEQRARFRLARSLVALGKSYYREGDHRRAGKLFDEAVKAAPGYFRGRRYQFLNFVKTTFARRAGD